MQRGCANLGLKGGEKDLFQFNLKNFNHLFFKYKYKKKNELAFFFFFSFLIDFPIALKLLRVMNIILQDLIFILKIDPLVFHLSLQNIPGALFLQKPGIKFPEDSLKLKQFIIFFNDPMVRQGLNIPKIF